MRCRGDKTRTKLVHPISHDRVTLNGGGDLALHMLRNNVAEKINGSSFKLA